MNNQRQFPVTMQYKYTVSQKKTWHYIFDDNFNKNCPIAIIFGTLITKIIGNRTVVSFSPPHLFNVFI